MRVKIIIIFCILFIDFCIHTEQSAQVEKPLFLQISSHESNGNRYFKLKLSDRSLSNLTIQSITLIDWTTGFLMWQANQIKTNKSGDIKYGIKNLDYCNQECLRYFTHENERWNSCFNHFTMCGKATPLVKGNEYRLIIESSSIIGELFFRH
ncbi:MAG: hypothetical protein H7A25_25920 [Leptospiraceae bacterium]|nr:hypothetical protein [Leptospiraceae bacterium]